MKFLDGKKSTLKYRLPYNVEKLVSLLNVGQEPIQQNDDGGVRYNVKHRIHKNSQCTYEFVLDLVFMAMSGTESQLIVNIVITDGKTTPTFLDAEGYIEARIHEMFEHINTELAMGQKVKLKSELDDLAEVAKTQAAVNTFLLIGAVFILFILMVIFVPTSGGKESVIVN
jgi:hypothetical protein